MINSEDSTSRTPPVHPAPAECKTEDGITIGLIDGIIATCRILSARDLNSPAVKDALDDMNQDGHVSQVIWKDAPSDTKAMQIVRQVSEKLKSEVRPAPVDDAMPRATPQQAAVGWILDVDYLDKVAAEMREATGYDATIECVEFCLLFASRTPTAAPVGERDKALEEALRTARNQIVLLGGEPMAGDHFADQVQVAVLEEIDRALKTQREG